MSLDILARLKRACESGDSPYDDIMSFNAMLNRKSVRQEPADVLRFLCNGVAAILEGCGACDSSTNDQLATTVNDSLSTLIKTWQGSAMPAFMSKCASTPTLPDELEKFLALLDSSKLTSEARSRFGHVIDNVRYHFCERFAHDSATKSLSCETLRRARGYAQIEGAASFLSTYKQFPEGTRAEAQAMLLSAHMWLADLLSQHSFASGSSNKSSSSSSSSSSPNDEPMWKRCVEMSLRLLCVNLLYGKATLEPDQFKALTSVEQARCLIQLAWRGIGRTVPAAVLFRRLSSLGFSTARPEFLLLTCVGLLSEAPATKSRDAAVQELSNVYFYAKPGAPLSSETGLKEDFEAFAKECLKTRGGDGDEAMD